MAIIYVDTLSQLNNKVSNNNQPWKINFMNDRQGLWEEV